VHPAHQHGAAREDDGSCRQIAGCPVSAKHSRSIPVSCWLQHIELHAELGPAARRSLIVAFGFLRIESTAMWRLRQQLAQQPETLGDKFGFWAAIPVTCRRAG